MSKTREWLQALFDKHYGECEYGLLSYKMSLRNHLHKRGFSKETLIVMFKDLDSIVSEKQAELDSEAIDNKAKRECVRFDRFLRFPHPKGMIVSDDGTNYHYNCKVSFIREFLKHKDRITHPHFFDKTDNLFCKVQEIYLESGETFYVKWANTGKNSTGILRHDVIDFSEVDGWIKTKTINGASGNDCVTSRPISVSDTKTGVVVRFPSVKSAWHTYGEINPYSWVCKKTYPDNNPDITQEDIDSIFKVHREKIAADVGGIYRHE